MRPPAPICREFWCTLAKYTQKKGHRLSRLTHLLDSLRAAPGDELRLQSAGKVGAARASLVKANG